MGSSGKRATRRVRLRRCRCGESAIAVCVLVCLAFSLVPIVTRYHISLLRAVQHDANETLQLVQTRSTNKMQEQQWFWQYRRAEQRTTPSRVLLSPLLPAARCRDYHGQANLMRFHPPVVSFYPVHDAKYLVSPSDCKCSHSQDLKMLIAVESSAESGTARNEVRASWGSEEACSDASLVPLRMKCTQLWKSLQVLFFVAQQELLDPTVREEADKYRDIVYYTVPKATTSETLRTLAVFQWIGQFCANASFILRLHDYAFVNIPYVLDSLTTLSADNDRLIMAHFAAQAPERNATKSEYIPLNVYSKPLLPASAQGAYILTPRSAKTLFDAAVCVATLRVERVFLTGLLASSLQMDKYHADCFVCPQIPNHMERCAVWSNLPPAQFSAFWQLQNSVPVNTTNRCSAILVPETM